MNSIKKALCITALFSFPLVSEINSLGLYTNFIITYSNGCAINLVGVSEEDTLNTFKYLKISEEDILNTFKYLKSCDDYYNLCLKIIKFFSRNLININDHFYLSVINLFSSEGKSNVVEHICNLSKRYASKIALVKKSYELEESKKIKNTVSEKEKSLVRFFGNENVKNGKAYGIINTNSYSNIAKKIAKKEVRRLNGTFAKFKCELDKEYLDTIEEIIKNFASDIGFPSWKSIEKVISNRSLKNSSEDIGCVVF